MFNRSDSDNINHWKIFQYKIYNMNEIQNTTKYIKLHVIDALNSSIDEGILIFQGRAVLGNIVDNETGKHIPISKELDIYLEALDEVRKREPKFQFNIIYLIFRNSTHEHLKFSLDTFLDLKKVEKYRDFLIGFDLVGDELLQKSDQFGSILLDYKKRNKDLEFYLHAGESMFEENDNLIDNFILECPRFGHGINLIKHSYLFDEIKKHS